MVHPAQGSCSANKGKRQEESSEMTGKGHSALPQTQLKRIVCRRIRIGTEFCT